MIRGTVVVVLTTITIATLKVFDIVRTMTGGNFQTNIIANEMYSQAFPAIELRSRLCPWPSFVPRCGSHYLVQPAPTADGKDGTLMTALSARGGLSVPQKKKAKDIFSSPIASAIAIVIAVLWTIPTFGLLVSSIRPESDINTSGWWTFFANPSFSLENYNQVLFEGTNVNPPLFQYFFNSLAVTIPAVIFPITLAVFAAYALAWFEFQRSRFLFFTIFALQVMPLQLALVPCCSCFLRAW
jgi:hypothetical protein